MVEAAMSGVKLLDLFSGIGGFHLGFERAGFEFDYVGFAEVDKYASAVYKYNNPFAEELGDVKSIRSENLPKIDIITFGSPCQDFSIAGKRAGATEGTRSSLIWEAIRLITECKPRVFVWENVKGTFSSNDGADFWAIIQAFTNIGSYRLEWQLLNTRWFLPQNRERLYLVGYTGDRGGRSVFPIGEDGKAITSKRKSRNAVSCIDASYHKGPDGKRTMINVVGSTLSTGAKGTNSRHWVYDSDGITGALSATDYKQPKQIKIADYRNDEGLRVRKDSVSPTLATRKHSQTDISTMPPFVWKDTVQPVIDPRRHNKSQNGCLIKEDGEDMFTLTQQDQHGVMVKSVRSAGNKDGSRYYYEDDVTQTIASNPTSDNLPMVNQTSIRRLTPVECMRLQGFPDNHNEFGLLDGKKVAISDTQRYKQAGNAVTVDVVAAVARKIKELL
jgi:DNA (cytosine-5)-methyltransferase 1|tara:strand:- start:1059 stop:2390 length:1332 start_codon:yes stop_codon:yes gene_type:complete